MYYRSSVDLSGDTREALVELLSQLLANSVDLFTQAKHAHWNVKGRLFYSAHELFDDIAKHTRKQSDAIAERITTLGGYAEGTCRQAAERTELPEFSPNSSSVYDCVEALVGALANQASALRHVIRRCAEELGDPATEDLLTETLRKVEFDMWFLESQLEDPRRTSYPHAPGEETEVVQHS